MDLVKLQALHLAHTLPHAWVFVSSNLASGLSRAQDFSQWLLCLDKASSSPCGKCRSCQLFAVKVHPDYFLVQPQDDKQSIAIQEVRNISDFVISKPQLSAVKVVVLYPAHAMHIQSANALLKTLEEPPSHTIYILLTSNTELLPKTIMSRCHIMQLQTKDDIKDSINMHVQAMLLDLEKVWIKKSLTSSQIVEAWLKQWPNEVLYCFDILLTDLLLYKYTGNVQLARAWCESAQKLCHALSSNKFWTILEKLRRAQYLVGHNQKPNMQLLLEDMLVV